MNEALPGFGPGGHRPDTRGMAPRFLVFGIAIVLAITGLGLRLFQLQIAEGATYRARSPPSGSRPNGRYRSRGA